MMTLSLLRTRVHELSQGTISTEERELKKNHLLTAMQLVCDLSELARREGLLALEEAIEKIESGVGTEYLKNLILLVEDGEIFARCSGFQPEEILELWIDAKVAERKALKK